MAPVTLTSLCSHIYVSFPHVEYCWSVRDRSSILWKWHSVAFARLGDKPIEASVSYLCTACPEEVRCLVIRTYKQPQWKAHKERRKQGLLLSFSFNLPAKWMTPTGSRFSRLSQGFGGHPRWHLNCILIREPKSQPPTQTASKFLNHKSYER